MHTTHTAHTVYTLHTLQQGSGEKKEGRKDEVVLVATYNGGSGLGPGAWPGSLSVKTRPSDKRASSVPNLRGSGTELHNALPRPHQLPKHCFRSHIAFKNSSYLHRSLPLYHQQPIHHNFALGFRGFDIVLGGVSVPENLAGKKGYIFDEAKERSGEVRFNNIAGEEFSQCTSDLEVRIIKSVEELFDSEVSTDISSSSIQVGPEIDLNVGLNGVGSLSNSIMNLLGSAFSSSSEQGNTQEVHADSHLNGHANVHAEACAGGSAEGSIPLVASAEAHFEGCIGGDIGGDIGTASGTSSEQTSAQAQAAQASKEDIYQSGTSFSLGAKVGAGFTIPPILKSLASNNKRTQKLATSIDSKEVITSIASTHCKRYAYQLQSYSPPFFHSAFKSGLATLNRCWNASADATPNSFQCARNFIESYGTHFIKRATFGAKVTTTRVMDYGKANKVSRQSLDDCTRSQSTWSALAVFTAGDKSSECQNNLSTGFSIDQSGLQTEHTESVGCKPSVDYGEDGPFPPEIIEKTLAPLSDLFTSDYMTEERVGEAIDYKGIGPWLYNKILDYCVLFKSEHHCKHTTRCGIVRTDMPVLICIVFSLVFPGCRTVQHTALE